MRKGFFKVVGGGDKLVAMTRVTEEVDGSREKDEGYKRDLLIGNGKKLGFGLVIRV